MSFGGNFNPGGQPLFFPVTVGRKESFGNQLENLDFEVLSQYVLNEVPPRTTELPQNQYQQQQFQQAQMIQPPQQNHSFGQIAYPDQQIFFQPQAVPHMNPQFHQRPPLQVHQIAVQQQHQQFQQQPFQPQPQPQPQQQQQQLQQQQQQLLQQQQQQPSQSDEPGRKKGNKLTPEEQVERRRERNRILARKTRLRKKLFFEALQRRVTNLKTENELLRGVAQRRLGDADRRAALGGLHSELPKVVTENMGQATEVIKKTDFAMMKLLTTAQKSFVITDPSTPDNPIVYASPEFTKLTGYAPAEIVGRNCRFLQGPATEPAAVAAIRRGVAEGRDTAVCLLNYRKDGTTFWNQFFIAPLHDCNGKVVNFVGVQCEVPHGPNGEGGRGDGAPAAVAAAAPVKGTV